MGKVGARPTEELERELLLDIELLDIELLEMEAIDLFRTSFESSEERPPVVRCVAPVRLSGAHRSFRVASRV